MCDMPIMKMKTTTQMNQKKKKRQHNKANQK